MTGLLVTGGAGFIGCNFVRFWRELHPEQAITVLDLLTYAGNRQNLADVADLEFVVGDILDTALVERLLCERDISTIVHFAAESHVDRSIVQPNRFVSTNVLGTHSLLEAARKVWLDNGGGRPHRFHQVSTDEVYGSLKPAEPPFVEERRYAPSSPYSASKASADHLVNAYHRTYGMNTTISACSNNYGPYQHPEKLIPLILLNCLDGRDLPIYGNGEYVRDWLHVEDHCRGIERVLAAGRPGEMYNIGGGQELSNLAVVDAICEAVNRAFTRQPELGARFPNAPPARGRPCSSLKTFVPDRPGHDRRYAMDCTKAQAELGYRPQRRFTEAFAETLIWYLDSEPWWRAVSSASLFRIHG